MKKEKIKMFNFKYLSEQEQVDIILCLKYFYDDYVLKYNPNFCLRKQLEKLLNKFEVCT